LVFCRDTACELTEREHRQGLAVHPAYIGLVEAHGLLARGVGGLELVRTKNKFASPGPTHNRQLLCNVRVRESSDGVELSQIAEIQLHLSAIASWDKESRAHEHYEYFRRELSGAGLGSNLEDFLDKTMSVYASICETPVRLSLLILVLEGAATREMPTSVGDLYRRAVDVALRDYVDGDGRLVGREALPRAVPQRRARVRGDDGGADAARSTWRR
jgi:hypothetical protein